MGYTIKATLQLGLNLEQIFDTTSLPAATGGGATLRHNQFSVGEITFESSAQGAAIPEAITKGMAFKKALSAGAATIDLTSLIGTLGDSESFSGLKVQGVLFYAPTSNADPITLTEGASNGYELMGDGWKATLKGGQSLLFRGFEKTPDVGGSAKTIDVSGTGTQEIYVVICAG